MARGRTERFITRRLDGESVRREPDTLIVEEPLSLRLDDVLVATTMRTPGADFELAAGFCHAEGWLDGAEIRRIRYCGEGPPAESEFNVVSVETDGEGPPPVPRLGIASSSCGICGAETVERLAATLQPLPEGGRFELATLAAVPGRMAALQDLFGATGAVHAAGVADRSGEPQLLREDIGRHNAVDKVVGRLLLDGRLPATSLCLYVSGRASFEMVQKAWAAGFGALVAVSAPSALAVQVARSAGLQLGGFARGGTVRIYAD
ncbi:MAG: formate dehydrogenase accessory sulfurtransferase FdhD [bacterium]|nr:formate dehydrogenase accessory sulfurtransferase FdhD [bacterium]